MKRTMIFAWISKTKRILFFSIVKKKIAINWRDKFHLRLVTFDGLSLEHWNIAMHHSASKMFAFCCKSLRCISCSKLYASQVAVRYDWAKSGCFFFVLISWYIKSVNDSNVHGRMSHDTLAGWSLIVQFIIIRVFVVDAAKKQKAIAFYSPRIQIKFILSIL